MEVNSHLDGILVCLTSGKGVLISIPNFTFGVEFWVAISINVDYASESNTQVEGITRNPVASHSDT